METLEHYGVKTKINLTFQTRSYNKGHSTLFLSLSLSILHTLENNIFLTIPGYIIAPFLAYLVLLFALFFFTVFVFFI